MLMRSLSVVSFSFGVLWATGCSSSDAGSGSPIGGGVGSPCAKDSDCTGYSKPSCLTDLRPLDTLVAPDAGTAGETFKKLDIPFPGGYCSNTIENSCQTDADCGSGGGCYRPLTGLSAATLTSLDNAVKVFSVTNFASKGLCLAPCTSDSECRTDQGYKCQIPLAGFITVVNPTYKNTYCIQPVDVSYLLMSGDGG